MSVRPRSLWPSSRPCAAAGRPIERSAVDTAASSPPPPEQVAVPATATEENRPDPVKAAAKDRRGDERDKGGKDGDGKYPDAVFVMTDGYGDKVVPQMPERWYWFIDGGMSSKTLTTSYCPEECAVYKLTDFE